MSARATRQGVRGCTWLHPVGTQVEHEQARLLTNGPARPAALRGACSPQILAGKLNVWLLGRAAKVFERVV